MVSLSPKPSDVATWADYVTRYNTRFSAMSSTPLPDNIHLLTLERWSRESFLVRLEHFYEAGEDAKLSQPAMVSLKVSARSKFLTACTILLKGGG